MTSSVTHKHSAPRSDVQLLLERLDGEAESLGQDGEKLRAALASRRNDIDKMRTAGQVVSLQSEWQRWSAIIPSISHNPLDQIHASRLKQSANARRNCDCGKRCGREKPRLAAATSGRHRIATGKANVFGFCSGAPPFVPKRKTRSLWLPARVVAVPAVSRFRARMRCGTRTVRFWRAMWPRVMCKRRHRQRIG